MQACVQACASLKTYWRVQAFRIGKMAANDEFTNDGLSLVDTVQRKLLNDLD